MAVVSAALLAHAACASTSYTPRGDGRIVTVMEDGSLVLMKDGQRFPGGADGLAQAVAGNPAAEEHARQHRQAMHLSLAENLIGLGAFIAGAIVVAPKQDANGNDLPISSQRSTAGSVLFLGGLAALIVGGFHTASAQGHYLDAINVYNDGVPPRYPAPPPGWQPAPPGLPPRAAPPVTPAPPNAAPPPAPPQAYPPPPAPPQ